LAGHSWGTFFEQPQWSPWQLYQLVLNLEKWSLTLLKYELAFFFN